VLAKDQDEDRRFKVFSGSDVQNGLALDAARKHAIYARYLDGRARLSEIDEPVEPLGAGDEVGVSVAPSAHSPLTAVAYGAVGAAGFASVAGLGLRRLLH
jgi:hypothetical protein